ncbi:MAG: HAD hydrolase family protein [Candidatus Omnitrophota bacterium]
MQKNKIIKLFKKVKLLILDVDGVLTKGEIIYDDRGRELKIFNVKDGLGISLVRKIGLKTVLLTAKNSAVVRRRSRDMHVAEVIGGVLPKESVLNALVAKYKVKTGDICFIGDDLIDIGIMERVGVPVAVNDAPAEVRRRAKYITVKAGGEGAVREVIDCIIHAQRLEKKICQIVRDFK